MSDFDLFGSGELESSINKSIDKISWQSILKDEYKGLIDSILTPTRSIRTESSVPYQQHWIPTRRSIKLWSAYWPPNVTTNKSTSLIVVLHGMSESRGGSAVSAAEPFLPMAIKLNLGVLAFEMCGHGHSEGQYVTYGHYEKQDLKDVITYIKSTFKTSSVILIGGQGLGASTAIQYVDMITTEKQDRRNFDIVITNAPDIENLKFKVGGNFWKRHIAVASTTSNALGIHTGDYLVSVNSEKADYSKMISKDGSLILSQQVPCTISLSSTRNKDVLPVLGMILYSPFDNVKGVITSLILLLQNSGLKIPSAVVAIIKEKLRHDIKHTVKADLDHYIDVCKSASRITTTCPTLIQNSKDFIDPTISFKVQEALKSSTVFENTDEVEDFIAKLVL